MPDFIKSLIVDFWNTMATMSPYLLFGFLVAGVLYVVISASFVEKHLGKRGIWPIVKASLFGVPLPLCSCGVIPVAMLLRRHGASKAATISFLLSTPQTGVDSFFVTFSLLGPVFAIFRPVIAFLTGLVGGIGVELFGGKPEATNDLTSSQSILADRSCEEKKVSKLRLMLRHGFVTLPRDIGKAMFVGLVIAAFISAMVPHDFFADKLGTGIGAMIVMMLLGIPVYVCATASVPIAAALMAKGLTAGAALVFLMTGPATNAAAFATIWKVLGGRIAIVYLASVAVCALGSGLLLDAMFPNLGTAVQAHMHQMTTSVWGHLSAVALLAVLVFAIFRRMNTAQVVSTGF